MVQESGPRLVPFPAPLPRAEPSDPDGDEEDIEAEYDARMAGSPLEVWSDEAHGFGPYSQLFSRMKPAPSLD